MSSGEMNTDNCGMKMISPMTQVSLNNIKNILQNEFRVDLTLIRIRLMSVSSS